MTAVAFLLPHLKVLSAEYAVSVVANSSDRSLLQRHGLDIQIQPVQIERPIRPLADLRAFFALYRCFRQHRFDVVHSVTPKAGLLAMMAACLARVPVRVHIFTGQVWATKTGAFRVVLKTADRLIAGLATHNLVDSPSQRDFLLKERVIDAERSEVLADGSICGVDLQRFRPDVAARRFVREEYAIPDGAVLLLSLGRLNKDKGIADLAASFADLAQRLPNLWLLLVGPDEQNMQSRVESICAGCIGRVVRVGFTDKPEYFMAAADIFCLPSYREGFGSSVIEAAASGVPAVASRIYGLTDAVEEGGTGLLHRPADVEDLSACIETLGLDIALRQRMGHAARMRVESKFSQSRLTNAMQAFYQRILKARP
jgi:glycosyltransferase involved in cell wall biosynthesis